MAEKEKTEKELVQFPQNPQAIQGYHYVNYFRRTTHWWLGGDRPFNSLTGKYFPFSAANWKKFADTKIIMEKIFLSGEEIGITRPIEASIMSAWL